MVDDRQALIGKWKVWVKNWVWEYEFFANGAVTWRDTGSFEKGAGRWSMNQTFVNLSWLDSPARESWRRPLDLNKNKRTWYTSPYYTGPYQIERVRTSPVDASEVVTTQEPPLFAPSAPPGPGPFARLLQKLTPRPTNWSIAGTATISGSFDVGGAILGKVNLAEKSTPGSPVSCKLAAAGLSLGPLPAGIEIAPSSFPSVTTVICAGPRTKTSELTLDDLTGPCVLCGMSSNTPTGTGTGGNVTVFFFNTGSNMSIRTLPRDLFNNLGPNPAINFLISAFETSKAFSVTAGTFVGLSIGVSLLEGVVTAREF